MLLYKFMIVLHVLVSSALVIVVLLQSSKGGGLAGAFGGGGSQTIFGGHETATFLSKATTYLAVLFMACSLILALLSSQRTVQRKRSAIKRTAARSEVIPRGENIDEFLGAAMDTTPAAGAADSE